MGEYQWMTYADVNDSAIKLGRGLRVLGQKSSQNIAVFAETRAEWMIAAHGCFKQNFPRKYFYLNYTNSVHNNCVQSLPNCDNIKI